MFSIMENRVALTFQVELPGGEDRLREMILYVAKECRDAQRFGKVKLNKILWRADFTAFRERGRPVTGCAYQKLAAGPAPLRMEEVLSTLQSRRIVSVEEVPAGGDYVEHRIIGHRDPDLGLFSVDDIYFVDKSVAFYWSKSASTASDLSHRVAWKSRAFLERMPYESAFLSDEKLSRVEKDKFHALAKAKGWKSL